MRSLPFTKEQLMSTMLAHVPEKFRELNQTAFQIGYDNQVLNGGK